MLLRTCRWLTLTLTALSMGVAFAHALQLLPKMQYAPALYLTLFKSLYEYYGKIAGWFEVGAVLAVIALVYLVRDRRPALLPTLIGAGCLVAAHAAYWIWVAPANNLMASWPVESPPADWTRVRDQWEYTHLARFFLQLLALAALQLSVVLETPDTAAETAATEQRTPFHGTRPSAA